MPWEEHESAKGAYQNKTELYTCITCPVNSIHYAIWANLGFQKDAITPSVTAWVVVDNDGRIVRSGLTLGGLPEAAKDSVNAAKEWKTATA
jgi:hypothetical protein